MKSIRGDTPKSPKFCIHDPNRSHKLPKYCTLIVVRQSPIQPLCISGVEIEVSIVQSFERYLKFVSLVRQSSGHRTGRSSEKPYKPSQKPSVLANSNTPFRHFTLLFPQIVNKNKLSKDNSVHTVSNGKIPHIQIPSSQNKDKDNNTNTTRLLFTTLGSAFGYVRKPNG